MVHVVMKPELSDKVGLYFHVIDLYVIKYGRILSLLDRALS